jgi:hypothetical protein
MPVLSEKFPTFQAFAHATLPEMFSEKTLAQATRLKMNTASSGMLLNDGQGRFTFRPLPRLAQIAPGFGLVFLHADEDAYPDLFIAQNFFSPHREIGRWDGGVSLLLRGQGDGSFLPVWPNKSGVVIPGDAAAAVAADINQDGWQDLLVAVNNEAPLVFLHHSRPAVPTLTVRLRGKPGNLQAIGARARLQLQSGRFQDAESYAGHGYLSQSASDLYFGLDPQDPPTSLRVQWPRGHTTSLALTKSTRLIEQAEP